MPKMILVRGLPGAGKSTTARAIIEQPDNNGKFNWIETDNYFDIGGKYLYNKDKVPAAHKWAQRQTEEAMLRARNVIISNTFITYSEMLPYLILAKEYGYEVEVIKCTGEFPNIHGVPGDVIQRMKERWED